MSSTDESMVDAHVRPASVRAARVRKVSLYLATLALALAAYLLIRSVGNGLTAPPPAPSDALNGAKASTTEGGFFGHVLLALLVITLAARLLGRACQWIRQPPVVGEIIAGILLGPSLLGRLAPEAMQFLVPHSVVPFLGAWSQIGAIFFMFLVGLHVDPRQMRHQAARTFAISHAGMILPFLMGATLALFLYPIFSASNVPFTGFSLFLGVSMSVTAFPVLARILTDRNAHTSPLGVLALACAAAGDLSAWCLLACVVSMVHSEATGGLVTILLALAFLAAILFVARPIMARVTRRTEERGRVTQATVAFVLLATLASAAATDAIGIHALIGAFALGVVVPNDSLLARSFIDRLQDVVVILFLPAYFAFTGLRTQIGLVTTPQEWLWFGVILMVAFAGKFGGVTAVARTTGLSWRASAALGILMNTRGLMELVVLNIGYDLGLLSPRLFAMLVLMAVITTLATTPIFHLLTRLRPITGGLARDLSHLNPLEQKR